MTNEIEIFNSKDTKLDIGEVEVKRGDTTVAVRDVHLQDTASSVMEQQVAKMEAYAVQLQTISVGLQNALNSVLAAVPTWRSPSPPSAGGLMLQTPWGQFGTQRTPDPATSRYYEEQARLQAEAMRSLYDYLRSQPTTQPTETNP